MSKVDLNLFVIFDAIMREKSITAAAQQLAMTQPSVSNAVSRMRHNWKDPLFVKDGRGMKPTPFAVKLWSQISDPLNSIAEAVTPTTFVPQYAKRSFRVGCTDGITALFWPQFQKILEREAPSVNVYAVPYIGNGENLLLEAEADLVINCLPCHHKQIRNEVLYLQDFVCVMRPDHPLSRHPLTLKDFLAAKHLLVSYSGDPTGVVDQKLAERDASRRVAMTVNSFAGAVQLIKESDLICVMPYPIVAKDVIAQDLISLPVPIDLAPVTISTTWHCRKDHDVGLQWLKGLFERIVAEHAMIFGNTLPALDLPYSQKPMLLKN